MKLILANRQTDDFRSFYADLQAKSTEPFDYAPYETMLFCFDSSSEQPIQVHNLADNRQITDYNGVYINGYLDTYELAATVALCCDALGVSFVNKELTNPPSLSKLTTYAKLAKNDVSVPKTFAGAKAALLKGESMIPTELFPAILKRADADRGIDNYKVASFDEVKNLLQDHDNRSIWLLQAFVPNEGFYLVSFYEGKPAFSIFRSLEKRPDGNEQKAHMFKPKGGANARLVPLKEVPREILETCSKAMQVMNRQIGSVDCIYTPETKRVDVLEVNYNPQLVTIETFKDVRVQAFLDNLQKDWQ
jgi:glutathione synthase/RimK-type ligase-like ATP-grasp enzyme